MRKRIKASSSNLLVYTKSISFLVGWDVDMSRVNTLTSVENIVNKMHRLSEEEQRALAAVVLEDRKLEAFVEELEDHLTCERATEEGSAELFIS